MVLDKFIQQQVFDANMIYPTEFSVIFSIKVIKNNNLHTYIFLPGMSKMFILYRLISLESCTDP